MNTRINFLHSKYYTCFKIPLSAPPGLPWKCHVNFLFCIISDPFTIFNWASLWDGKLMDFQLLSKYPHWRTLLDQKTSRQNIQTYLAFAYLSLAICTRPNGSRISNNVNVKRASNLQSC